MADSKAERIQKCAGKFAEHQSDLIEEDHLCASLSV